AEGSATAVEQAVACLAEPAHHPTGFGVAAAVRQFPELAGVAVTHRWSGLVAMTMDSIPHAGRLDDRIVYAVGYNGTGVALASNMGKHIAAIVVGESPDLGLLTSERLKPVPFYPIREPAVRLVAGWYQFLDAIGR
ncbi:FAD-dependent oxidoreductase, partial [Rhizobium johnstonii]